MKAKQARQILESNIEVIYEALEEIKEAMRSVEDEDVELEFERANCTWMAHIDGALLSRFGWCGGSVHDANDTIDNLVKIEESGEI